ncbi:MAG: TM2 domain-containing protein [Clostridia bacterium]|nr:TM2 domain-containing protein [Clostridia bacterium]
MSKKSRLVTLLLCLFVGELGIHRFYVGIIGTGVHWLLTGGLLGIGWLVDLICIVLGSFKDSDGNEITNWDVNGAE